MTEPMHMTTPGRWIPQPPLHLRDKDTQKSIRDLVARDREIRAREMANLIHVDNMAEDNEKFDHKRFTDVS